MATYTVTIPANSYNLLHFPQNYIMAVQLAPNEYVTSVTLNAISSFTLRNVKESTYLSGFLGYLRVMHDVVSTTGTQDDTSTKLISVKVQYNVSAGESTIGYNQTRSWNVASSTSTITGMASKGKVLYIGYADSTTALLPNGTPWIQVVTPVTFSIVTAYDNNSAVKSGRYNGSSYDPVQPYYYNGSAWIPCEWKRYNGSSWDDVDTM